MGKRSISCFLITKLKIENRKTVVLNVLQFPNLTFENRKLKKTVDFLFPIFSLAIRKGANGPFPICCMY